MPVPRKNQLVGLDIGSHSIKLVEIDDSKKGMILKSFGIVHLPKDTIVEGSIKEIEVAATAIKNHLFLRTDIISPFLNHTASSDNGSFLRC